MIRFRPQWIAVFVLTMGSSLSMLPGENDCRASSRLIVNLDFNFVHPQSMPAERQEERQFPLFREGPSTHIGGRSIRSLMEENQAIRRMLQEDTQKREEQIKDLEYLRGLLKQLQQKSPKSTAERSGPLPST